MSYVPPALRWTITSPTLIGAGDTSGVAKYSIFTSPPAGPLLMICALAVVTAPAGSDSTANGNKIGFEKERSGFSLTLLLPTRAVLGAPTGGAEAIPAALC